MDSITKEKFRQFIRDNPDHDLHKLSLNFDMKLYNEIQKDEHGKLIPTTIDECDLVNCPECVYDNENEICETRGEFINIEKRVKK